VPSAPDVFLSHHSRDKQQVEAIARHLVARGFEPWLDKWCLVPGDPWQEAIERALAQCKTCAVFIGREGTGPWHHEEMRAAIDRRVRDSERKFRVIPVLLPGGLRGARSGLPTFLEAATWVEFRRDLDDEDALHRFACGIRGVAPGPGPGQAVYEGKTPYKGLRVFDVDDWPFYFGRETKIEWLLDDLRSRTEEKSKSRFLGLVGASGSGKSSLLRAGLLSRLKRGAIPESQTWPTSVLKPGPDPVESLALACVALHESPARAPRLPDLIADLKRSPATLHQQLRLVAGDGKPAQRAILAVDQLEEVFTLCGDEALRKAFLDNIVYAGTVAFGPSVILATLRADFYGHAASHAGLAVALAEQNELLGAMRRDELLLAIREPALRAGAVFEEGLAEKLVEDVAEQTGGLPLLQHALLELWNERASGKLLWRTYTAMGGVTGALDKRADAVYAAFATDAQRQLCQRIFLRLTRPGRDTEDTRQRVSKESLRPRGGDAAMFDAVLESLAEEKARLIVMTDVSASEGERSPPARPADVTVEVAHEALIRSWRTLRGWLDQRRPALLVLSRLGDDAKTWRAHERDPSFLYRGRQLEEARKHAETFEAELSELELEFLKGSEEAHSRETRLAQSSKWTRRLQWVLPALLLASVALGVGYAIRKDQLNFQEQKERMRAMELSERGGSLTTHRPLAGLRLRLEGLHATRDPALTSVIRDAIVKQVATGQIRHITDGNERIILTPTIQYDRIRETQAWDPTNAPSAATRWLVVDGKWWVNEERTTVVLDYKDASTALVVSDYQDASTAPDGAAALRDLTLSPTEPLFWARSGEHEGALYGFSVGASPARPRVVAALADMGEARFEPTGKRLLLREPGSFLARSQLVGTDGVVLWTEPLAAVNDTLDAAVFVSSDGASPEWKGATTVWKAGAPKAPPIDGLPVAMCGARRETVLLIRGADARLISLEGRPSVQLRGSRDLVRYVNQSSEAAHVMCNDRVFVQRIDAGRGIAWHAWDRMTGERLGDDHGVSVSAANGDTILLRRYDASHALYPGASEPRFFGTDVTIELGLNGQYVVLRRDRESELHGVASDGTDKSMRLGAATAAIFDDTGKILVWRDEKRVEHVHMGGLDGREVARVSTQDDNPPFVSSPSGNELVLIDAGGSRAYWIHATHGLKELVYQPANRFASRDFERQGARVSRAKFALDGSALALMLNDQRVELWSTAGGQPRLLPPLRGVDDVEFLGAHAKLLVRYTDRVVRLLDLDLMDVRYASFTDGVLTLLAGPGHTPPPHPVERAVCAAVKQPGNWTREDEETFRAALDGAPSVSCP
jgi:hypothetical protein